LGVVSVRVEGHQSDEDNGKMKEHVSIGELKNGSAEVALPEISNAPRQSGPGVSGPELEKSKERTAEKFV